MTLNLSSLQQVGVVGGGQSNTCEFLVLDWRAQMGSNLKHDLKGI